MPASPVERNKVHNGYNNVFVRLYNKPAGDTFSSVRRCRQRGVARVSARLPIDAQTVGPVTRDEVPRRSLPEMSGCGFGADSQWIHRAAGGLPVRSTRVALTMPRLSATARGQTWNRRCRRGSRRRIAGSDRCVSMTMRVGRSCRVLLRCFRCAGLLRDGAAAADSPPTSCCCGAVLLMVARRRREASSKYFSRTY
jgi:hypothetical protein